MRLTNHAGSKSLLILSAVWISAPVAPVAAQQNSISQEFDDIRSSVGLGQSKPPVDFTERAPLVVPPTYTLPPPGSAADSLGVNDTDIAARRAAMSDPRRPIPPSDPGATATGRSSRTYLIDPPSGMRDPNVVAAQITTDSSSTPAKTSHHRYVRKTSSTQQASQ